MDRFLEISIIDKDDVKYQHSCDGCGRKYKLGEKRVWGIESCCGGGCARNLCSDCIEWAYNKLKGKG